MKILVAYLVFNGHEYCYVELSRVSFMVVRYSSHVYVTNGYNFHWSIKLNNTCM
jgi:hypothetical protein